MTGLLTDAERDKPKPVDFEQRENQFQYSLLAEITPSHAAIL
jgi:hypothetical protein